MESRHEVCVALDKTAVEMLRLMEQKVRSQMNVENAAKTANIHLAKSRYIAGQQTVCRLQLPTENTPDFEALSTVDRCFVDEGSSTVEQYTLTVKKPEPDSMLINPIKWFGVLVPQNLHQAQNFYRNILEYIVESVNVDGRLRAICDEIARLKEMKYKYAPEE